MKTYKEKQGIGLYFHIPFCAGKCPYCDFYSVSLKNGKWGDAAGDYIGALERYIKTYPQEKADTVYFGGGTPGLMGARRLSRLLELVKEHFDVSDNAEITVEVNPGDLKPGFFPVLYGAGFNRISIGMQSAVDSELKMLGRRHSCGDVSRTVKAAAEAGFKNISLDLMLALPDMTEESLKMTLDFAMAQGIQHVSAYILKIEPDTPFARIKKQLRLPDDDRAADFYFQAADYLDAHGFKQYEISNFALPGYEGRHNLMYWRCREYIGIGPSAHSFYKGKRFYYPRSLAEFLQEAEPLPDGDGGGLSEYIILKLRLSEGLSRRELTERFPEDAQVFDYLLGQAKQCPADDLEYTDERIRLTAKGFAVANSILTKLVWDLI